MQTSISKIKEFDPQLAALIFILGFSHQQLLALLKSIYKSFKKPSKEKEEQYVGIHITNKEYYIGVGVPIYNRLRGIDDFMLNHQKKGLLNDNPNVTIPKIISEFKNKQYKFLGISTYWPNINNLEIAQNEQENNQSWKSYPVVDKLRKSIKAQSYQYQSNINANCLAQYKLGNHNARQSFVYVDVGSEVSIGIIVGGKVLHGYQSIQGGHIIVQRHPDQNPSFKGTCSKHSNCLEGYINIESIVKRCNIDVLRLHTVRNNDPVWKLIGFYLAQLCINLTYLLSPETIVINGQIISKKQILDETQNQFIRLLNKYVRNDKLQQQQIKTYITKPRITLSSPGVKGCMILKNSK